MNDPMKSNDNKIIIGCIIGVFYIAIVLFCINMANYEASLPMHIKKTSIDIILDTSELVQKNGLFNCFPIQGNVLKYLIPVTLIMALIILLVYTDSLRNKHDMANKEHGSSIWNRNFKDYNKKYSDPIGEKHHNGKRNIILSNDLFMSLDTFATQRNLNILYVGGSGTGKSRFGVKPNILCANTSYLITDPSGEILESLGKTMLMLGYKIKIFNLVNMEESNHYNPFDYINKTDQTAKENDVMKMIDCLLANTSDPNAQKGDPFWDDSMKALFLAICYLIIDFEEEENINFTTVLRYIQMGKMDENTRGPVKTELDQKFESAKKKQDKEIELGTRTYESKAFTNYDTFKLAGIKTAQSILISASVRINKFSNTSVSKLTKTDFLNPENNVNLHEIGNEATCLFVIIPTADLSFNFLVSMMYSQFFEVNYYKGETINPKKYLIQDLNGNPIKTMIDTEEEAYDLMEIYINKSQIKKVERVERLMSNKTSDDLRKKKEEAKKRREEELKKKGIKTKNFKKSKKIKKDYKGYYTCYQVVIPFEELPEEEYNKLEFKEKMKYKERKAKGDTVIREFYSEIMAKEFKESFNTAEVKKGRIESPWHIRLELDEFANIGTIPQFAQRVATMRKYGISVNIILQNLEQLKTGYKDDFSGIKGNCDINILLGTSEIETAKEYSELLGDATITVKSRSRNLGKNGGSSNSFQQSGRKLMDPAEITKMDNRYSIVRIRGENPFFTRKFEYTKHPNYQLTGDADDVNKFDEEYKETFFMGLKRGSGYVSSLKEALAPFDNKDAVSLDENKIGKTQLTQDIDAHLYDLNIAHIEDIPSVLIPVETTNDMEDSENYIGDINDVENVKEIGREQMIDAENSLDLFSQTIINNDASNTSFFLSEQIK